MNHPIRKILFCGYGRAGKDEAATYLGKITTLRYAGSFSWAALPHMAKVLDVHPCQAWEERHKNRQLWKDELDRLRTSDQCHLARLVLATGELAAGLRDKLEIDAVKAAGLFDLIVWVNRPGTPVDPTVTYGPEDCDLVLDNDGDLEHFHTKLLGLAIQCALPLRGPTGPIGPEGCPVGHEGCPGEAGVPFVPVVVKPFAVGDE